MPVSLQTGVGGGREGGGCRVGAVDRHQHADAVCGRWQETQEEQHPPTHTCVRTQTELTQGFCLANKPI